MVTNDRSNAEATGCRNELGRVGWDGGQELCDARSGTQSRDGGELRTCALSRRTIAVSFPRWCARGGPRWVRFEVLGFRDGEGVTYLDDALRDEPFLSAETDTPAQSRRVYRG